MVLSSSALPAVKYRPTLSARLALLGLVLFADKIFINGFLDSDTAQTAQGLGAGVHVFQHWGFRFLVAAAAALVLFSYVRGGPELRRAATSMRDAPIRWVWVAAHLLLIAVLAFLSYLLYRHTPSQRSFAAVAAAWILVGAGAALAAMLALSPRIAWLGLACSLGTIWVYAPIAALLGTAAIQWSEHLWGPAATLTFDLVSRVLSPFLPTLIADPSTRVLGTNRFLVQIADECSGLEGVSLVLIFTVAWLIYFRREYVFPRALLLVPLGMASMFVLNAVRIAALVLIGNAGFGDVAVFGFHSQAGWLAFNLVACALAVLSRRIVWLRRSADSPAGPAGPEVQSVPGASDNPTAAYLMPFLAILAAGMVSQAMSTRFEFFYPLRVIAAAIVLWIYRKRLMLLDWRASWRGLAVGASVFAVWIASAHVLIPAAGMPVELAAMQPATRGLWIGARLVGSLVTVPIAEELAYRGYLLRRISHGDFEAVPFQSVRWPALCVTAVIFGLVHGALWLPAIVAGLAYGLVVMHRGRLGEAVLAHATTNALVAAAVLGWGQWQLW
jgi:exosortase E/protease (VPEID-CTERM system)